MLNSPPHLAFEGALQVAKFWNDIEKMQWYSNLAYQKFTKLKYMYTSDQAVTFFGCAVWVVPRSTRWRKEDGSQGEMRCCADRFLDQLVHQFPIPFSHQRFVAQGVPKVAFLRKTLA